MLEEAELFFNSDNQFTKFTNSRIHPNLTDPETKPEVVLGIDEAGRGPVLGPMTYACCFAPLDKHNEIREQGCEDSKQLKDEQRRNILEKITDLTVNEKNGLSLGWIYEVITPTYISTGMLAPCKYNLNEMSHDSASFLVRSALDKGVNVTKVFVDTVGTPEKYQAKLSQRFPGIQFCVEKKADDTYPCCSAASIVAKVLRDVLVEKWQHCEPAVSNKNRGSGYPGDVKSIDWLKKYFDPVFGFPQFVRFSWGTAKKIMVKDGVGLEFESDDDEENDDAVLQDNGRKRKKCGQQMQLFKPIRAAVFRKAKLERIGLF